MKILARLLIFSLLMGTAGASPVPACFWAGPVAKCYPPTGMYLDSGRSLRLGNVPGNYVEIQAASPSATYTLKLPIGQGGASTFLKDDGTGILSWAPATTSVSGTAPIVVSPTTGAAVVSIPVASGSANGYLSSTDWTTFNNKGSGNGTITSVNFTDSGGIFSIAGVPVTSGAVTIAESVTGLSGGIPYFNLPGQLSSSGMLGLHGILAGGGTGGSPVFINNNSSATNEFLTQSSSNAAVWAALVSGDIPNLDASKITTGTLPVARGGTGLSAASTTNGQALVTSAGAVAWGAIELASSGAVHGTLGSTNGGTGLSAVGTNGQALTTAAGAIGWNAINLASSAAVTGTLPLVNGGLGLAAVGTNGQALTTAAGALGWNAINLASSAAVTGTLPVGNGGTGLTAISTINGQQITTSAGAVSWGYTELASSGAVHGTLGTANGGLGVTSGTSNQVFRVTSGASTFAFGTIYLATGSGVNANPGQVQGTGTSDNAASGNIGEYIESLAGTSSIPGASGAYGEITHITLTPGDWDVTGFIQVLRNGATFSTDAIIQLGIIGVTASGTGMSDGQNSTEYDLGTSNLLTFNRLPLTIPPVRVTVSPTAGVTINGTTTSTFIVYLNLYVSTYSVATPTYTARLSARRVR